MIKDYAHGRDKIIEYVKRTLRGPMGAENEILSAMQWPNTLYKIGVLYPPGTQYDDIEDIEAKEINTENSKLTENSFDDTISKSNEWNPSSLGVSFFVKSKFAPSIQINYDFGLYLKEEYQELKRPDISNNKLLPYKKGEKGYRRVPVKNESAFRVTYTKNTLQQIIKIHNEDCYAEIFLKWREVENFFLVTVMLINRNTVLSDGKTKTFKPEHCLFQAGIKIIAENGTQIVRYREIFGRKYDEEKEALSMLYRNHLPYAAGHGCAVQWTESDNVGQLGLDGGATEVWTETVPTATLYSIDFNLEKKNQYELASNALDYEILADTPIDNYQDVLYALDAFISGYDNWIKERQTESLNLSNKFSSAAKNNLNNCQGVADRIRKGRSFLEDETICEAFILANKAMLMQMVHGKTIDDKIDSTIDLKSIFYGDLKGKFKWRPFQLAFLLMSIPSIVQPNDFSREIVDLIWFPTGGGKTEAYLGLAAFTLFYLRLQEGDAATGTNIIMRYTLRALTTQQFQRALRLICACELIRRDHPVLRYNQKGFTIGLFVGRDASPNTWVKAQEMLNDIQFTRSENPFIILHCPWCNEEIFPKQGDIGIIATDTSFQFKCPNKKCDFHEEIPANIVDETLYTSPPDFLIGTVDKFAQLPWEPNIFALFGQGKNGQSYLPPTLIIQDELHLISGPLGSIVGAYEVVIDALCTSRKYRPKIIASTATISHAKSQCKGLFDRSVTLFPPPGLDVDDSYFAKTDYSSPGRKYVGIWNTNSNRLGSAIRLHAALLQSIEEIEILDNVKDAYATVVSYFNTKKDLGTMRTLARDEIPARIKLMRSKGHKTRYLKNTQDFTSDVPSRKIPVIINHLYKGFNEKGFIDLLLSTNMISVGIDIPRLSLMVMNGQPKTTSEYIQASSRIGRKYAGLVFILYAPTRSRDRSHYEKFATFHQTIYRDVEPTSVTPFSIRARERTLHALLITLCRYHPSLKNSPCKFSAANPVVIDIVEKILERIKNIDELEYNDAKDQLTAIVKQWEDNKTEKMLRYYQNGIQFTNLMYHFLKGNEQGFWPTLSSMRNVDVSLKLDDNPINY